MSFQPNAVGGQANSDVGTIVDYVEFNTDTVVSATTEATAQTIVTGAGWTPNGTDAYWIEFFAPGILTGASAGSQLRLSLYDNGSAIVGGASLWGQYVNPAAATSFGAAALLRRKIVPSNAAHAYSVRAWRLTSNGNVLGTNAGIGLPGYLVVMQA